MDKKLKVKRPFQYQGKVFAAGDIITEKDVEGILTAYISKGMIEWYTASQAPKIFKNKQEIADIKESE